MASVRIETYRPEFLEGMAAAYNRETADEPHIAPLTPARFDEFVARKSHFDPSGVLVAMEGEQVVGWVHACWAPPSEPWNDESRWAARIVMFIFPPEHMAAGAPLLAAAITWLKGTGAAEADCLHPRWGYPFYRGLWLGSEPVGTASLPHLQAALAGAGFKSTFESLMMTAALDREPEAIPAGVPLSFIDEPAQMAHDGMRESWQGFSPMRTRALLRGEEAIGHVGWVMLPHVADRLGAPALNIWSMGVNEEHRRRGVARAMMSRVLALGYQQGARFCSVSTQLWNLPAQRTYAAWGYRPYRLLIGRTIELEPAQNT